MWSIWRARSYKYISSIWKEDLVLKLCLYLHLPDEHSYPLPAFPSSKPIVFFWVIFQDNNNIRFRQGRICFHEMFFLGENVLITPSREFRKSIITIKQLHIYIHRAGSKTCPNFLEHLNMPETMIFTEKISGRSIVGSNLKKKSNLGKPLCFASNIKHNVFEIFF